MQETLERELSEELGISITDIEPAFFKDCLHTKTLADGTRRLVYMVFLLFHCTATQEVLKLNEEFSEYRWVGEGELNQLDLNSETLDTLKRLGPWKDARHRGTPEGGQRKR